MSALLLWQNDLTCRVEISSPLCSELVSQCNALASTFPFRLHYSFLLTTTTTTTTNLFSVPHLASRAALRDQSRQKITMQDLEKAAEEEMKKTDSSAGGANAKQMFL